MILFRYVFLATFAHASLFEPEYAKWSQNELRTWLEHHNIKVPPSFDKSQLYDLINANWQNSPCSEASQQWSLDQFRRVQGAFEHLKEDSFDEWDESKLRTFLLEQGAVAPSGPREQLINLVRNKYCAYTDAATRYSSLASASASSAYAGASDAAQSASKSISSTVSQATHDVARALDDTKDYVYSTWNDHRLRTWLEDRGVVEAKDALTRDELIRLAKDYYRKASSAVWESWSDSYIREWLFSHNLLKPTDTPSRSSLLEKMKMYYYNCAENVWHTWSESELKNWLINHDLLKSDSEKNRDELVKMVGEYYLSVPDTIWAAWADSEIRQWLSEHGYLDDDRSDKKSRKNLVDLIDSKYPDMTVAPYLVWPDARLRAYLREIGISESALQIDRPGLLQETRIRWVQAANRVESVFTRLRQIVDSSAKVVEEKIARALEALSGHSLRHVAEKVCEERK